jgi:succinyl-diaminopimelate desuccinylase
MPNITTPSETLKLAIELIQRPSVTPNDAGCIPLIAERLKKVGFSCEILRFGEVDNLWAKRGQKSPLLVFVGHTDVVPPGALESWNSPPFEPVIRDGYLAGRGAVDMKGSLAAMLVATEQFLAAHPQFLGSIAFLLTSDEEGPAINGTRQVAQTLIKRGEKIDWCIVGEPSSLKQVGDVARNGRRGSLSADLVIKGVQGHVAYPHLAKNPIHSFAPVLKELVRLKWDNGNAFFPPTQFQIVNINSDNSVDNVTPEKLIIRFNFRYSPEVTVETLQDKLKQLLETHQINYEISWRHSAEPFLTMPGALIEKVSDAIFKVMRFKPQLLTDGGTSDGRFIAPLGAQVVELGLCNATIHQVNECAAVEDLEKLTMIYQRALENLYTN